MCIRDSFGIPSVLYSDPSYDMTEEVVKEVNKDRPAAKPVAAAAPASKAPTTGAKSEGKK